MKKDINEKTNEISIRNGHWGIYNELESLPEERWDPFRTIIVKETKIGHSTIISSLRGEKPYEYLLQQRNIHSNELKEGKDSFCRLIKGELPSIVLSHDQAIVKDPLSVEPKYENLESTKVFSSINLYSPIPRIFQNEKSNISINKKIPTGIPLIHVFKNHYRYIEEVPEDEMSLLLRNMAMTTERSQETLLEIGKSEKINIFQFFNIGMNAGASIPHLHAQTYLFKDKPGYGWKNKGFLEVLQNHKTLTRDNNYCIGCKVGLGIEKDPLGQEFYSKRRVVWENDHWIGFVVYAPERDSHLRLLPKRHVGALWISLDQSSIFCAIAISYLDKSILDMTMISIFSLILFQYSK
jgi:galactose-1-phosphate uridylyltransferase